MLVFKGSCHFFWMSPGSTADQYLLKDWLWHLKAIPISWAMSNGREGLCTSFYALRFGASHHNASWHRLLYNAPWTCEIINNKHSKRCPLYSIGHQTTVYHFAAYVSNCPVLCNHKFDDKNLYRLCIQNRTYSWV